MAESLAIFEAEFKRISGVIKDFVTADLGKEYIAALDAGIAAKNFRELYKETIAGQLKTVGDFAAVKKSAKVAGYEKDCLAIAKKSEILAAEYCRKMGLVKKEGKAIEKLIADIDKDLKDRGKASKSKPKIENIKKDLVAIKAKFTAQKNNLGVMVAASSGKVANEKSNIADIDSSFQKNLDKARDDALGDMRVRKMDRRVIIKYGAQLKSHAAEAMAALMELEDAKKKAGTGFDAKSHKAYKDALAAAKAGIEIMDEYEAADKHCKNDKDYVKFTTKDQRDFAQATLTKMRGFRAGILDTLADLKKV